MESKNTLTLLFAIIFLSLPLSTFGQWDQLKKKVQQKVEETLDGDNEGRTAKLIAKFERGQPISTTFDDAIYEADFLGNFEPEERDYRPLDIQPRAEKGGFRLQSGLYTMDAKSFCLRGYTYGPSKGDGHLYAPMKGKKADFVQSIIRRYGQKPEIPQQDVQVLLWAIIAGADMNTLGAQHTKTLNALFTAEELLQFRGKDWLNGFAEKQFDDLKRETIGKTPPQLQALLDADNKIRTMVKENKSFQEIERVAIISGVAPRDMVREVSKGAWSYHPDGYFVRFFPNGYRQTRVDVYVPYQGAVQTDAKGKAIGISTDSKTPKEVIFDPSGMVASPANRPSQRIGVSPVPLTPPCQPPKNDNSVNFKVSGIPVIAQPNEHTCWAAVATMMYLWKNGRSTGSAKDIESTLEKHSWSLKKYYDLFPYNKTTPGIFDDFYTNDMKMSSHTKCHSQNWWAWPWIPNEMCVMGTAYCLKPIPTILELQDLLCRYGPLALTYNKGGGHIVIISGIKGNGTSTGTSLSIIDPWNFDREQQYEITFQDFYNTISATIDKNCDYYNIYHW